MDAAIQGGAAAFVQDEETLPPTLPKGSLQGLLDGVCSCFTSKRKPAEVEPATRTEEELDAAALILQGGALSFLQLDGPPAAAPATAKKASGVRKASVAGRKESASSSGGARRDSSPKKAIPRMKFHEKTSPRAPAPKKAMRF